MSCMYCTLYTSNTQKKVSWDATCYTFRDINKYRGTRTAAAAGPLVLESGGSVFFFVFLFCCCNLPHQFLFQSNNFSISPQYLPQILPHIWPQTTTTNHNHNWGVNIYYYTNFCSNPTIFQFYHKFYHIFYHKFYHKLLPQTTIIIRESISTTTPIFVPIQQFFNFTTHFTTYVTKNFTTNHYHYLHQPPTKFSGPKINTYKCFERPAKIFIVSN